MELLQQNLPQTLMVAGIAALIIEVAVLGFAVFRRIAADYRFCNESGSVACNRNRSAVE